MVDVKALTDEELMNYINKAECCTNQIFSNRFDRTKDKYLYPEMDQIFDMETIRQQDKYKQILSLAIRMGLPIRDTRVSKDDIITKDSIVPVCTLSTRDKDRLVTHILLLEEVRRRQLNIYDKNVRFKAYDHPETISDVTQSLDFHNQPNQLSSINRFDYPVRNACIVLFSKGYIPYWSSANKMDTTEERKGLAVEGKNVAYILIDPSNFPPELESSLKSKLLLSGTCAFPGLEASHADNGNYYGIWEEITGHDMNSDTLSKLLLKKAIALPDIHKENRFEKGKGK